VAARLRERRHLRRHQRRASSHRDRPGGDRRRLPEPGRLVPFSAWPPGARASGAGPRCAGARNGQGHGCYRREEHIVAIATVNPATGETVKTFDEMSEEAVEMRLAAAA